MKRLLTWSAAVVFAAQPILGADSHGRFAVGYPGNMECETLAAAKAGSQELVATAGFMEGWLAAHARLMPNTYDLSPWQTIEYLVAQMQAFCGANPSAPLVTGLMELTAFLTPDALQEESALRPVSNGEQIIMLPAALLERVQAKLIDLGFAQSSDTDPVTGLSAFQQAQNLPTSGLPDQATLARLFAPRQ